MASAKKKAKLISKEQVERAVAKARTGTHPLRDEVALRLSYAAGLRGGEIARVRWSNNILDAEGRVQDFIHITGDVAKRSNERIVPIGAALKSALVRLRKARPEDIYVFYALTDQGAPKVPMLDSRGRAVKHPETGKPVMQVDPAWEGNVTANAAVQWFRRFYKDMNYEGCTSHSGRRAFITELAREANTKNCSLKDVQILAGHKRLETTGDYIEPSAGQVALVSRR